ncbi:MAG TPA: hypothetical protein VFK41_06510 [Nocardioidaceae bacterium]|nr:hypothetical protein [Nocardioidaceae bacterium]
MTDVTDTFVKPCLRCGMTTRVIGGTLLEHVCQTFDEKSSPAAYAWWQGYDAAGGRALLVAADEMESITYDTWNGGTRRVSGARRWAQWLRDRAFRLSEEP